MDEINNAPEETQQQLKARDTHVTHTHRPGCTPVVPNSTRAERRAFVRKSDPFVSCYRSRLHVECQ